MRKRNEALCSLPAVQHRAVQSEVRVQLAVGVTSWLQAVEAEHGTVQLAVPAGIGSRQLERSTNMATGAERVRSRKGQSYIII